MKRMKRIKILLLGMCCICLTLSAQKAKKDTLIQRNPGLEKEYQPIDDTAEKILQLPDIEKSSIEKQPFEFSTIESPIAVRGDYTPLPAAGLKATFPSSDQLGYVRLGVGGHRSFLGDAQVNLLRESKQSLDICFLHRSIFGDIVIPSGESQKAYTNNNFLLATYKLYLDNSEINASFSEKYNAWNYYGTWRTDSLGSNALNVPDSQWSSDSKFGFGIKSKDLGQQFSYIVNAEGHLFKLGNGVSSPTSGPGGTKGGFENEFAVKAVINYDLSNLIHVGINGQMRSFSYSSPVSYPANETLAYNANNINNDFENRRWFEFSPYAKMTYKRWLLSAGIKMSVPSLVNERVKGNLIASASTALGPKAEFRAVLDGGVHPLSYREGFEMNPYLDPSIRLKSSWTPIDLSAIIDYRPSRNLRISPVVRYDITTDMPFFYNGYPTVAGSTEGINNTYGRLFSVMYMNSNRLRIGVNGLYSLGAITILGEAYSNSYLNFSKTDAIDKLLAANGRKAWNRPGIEMHLRADFSLDEKTNLFVDYKMEAFRYTADATDFCKQMGDMHLVNIGANYQLTKEVSIFLHVDNLLDQRYEVWDAYQVHGFTAAIGGAVSF